MEVFENQSIKNLTIVTQQPLLETPHPGLLSSYPRLFPTIHFRNDLHYLLLGNKPTPKLLDLTIISFTHKPAVWAGFSGKGFPTAHSIGRGGWTEGSTFKTAPSHGGQIGSSCQLRVSSGCWLRQLPMASPSGPFKTAQLWFPHIDSKQLGSNSKPPEVPAGSDLIFITQHQKLCSVVTTLPDSRGVTDINLPLRGRCINASLQRERLRWNIMWEPSLKKNTIYHRNHL